jgi:hypothetical protein
MVLAVPLLIAACGSETTELPPGLGPVALTTDVPLPVDCEAANAAGTLLTVSESRPVLGNPSYNERKARGCVPYSIAQVWAALQIPGGAEVSFYPERDQSDCDAWLLSDPAYPINFVTKEIPKGSSLVAANWFEVTWRIGVSQGTTADPQEVKVLYGKTAGTTQVPKILGSMVFSPDPVHPNWTRIDMVRQLNTNGWSDEPFQLNRWIVDYHGGLMALLATGHVPPPTGAASYCNVH